MANDSANTATAIDTATGAAIATVPVGTNASAFGAFIQPLPRFAGTPGTANCHGVSVSALANKYGGLNSAAAAFGYAKVQGLQDAIRAFCGN
ncbi:MAG: hypothetical protein JO239_12475 [Paraburkholderia sp.]|nr:hypothetical protein [Paraburkholderia sp.]